MRTYPDEVNGVVSSPPAAVCKTVGRVGITPRWPENPGSGTREDEDSALNEDQQCYSRGSALLGIVSMRWHCFMAGILSRQRLKIPPAASAGCWRLRTACAA